MNLNSSSFINLLKQESREVVTTVIFICHPILSNAFVTGTERAGESTVTISGAIPDPSYQIKIFLQNIFKENHIDFNGSTI